MTCCSIMYVAHSSVPFTAQSPDVADLPVRLICETAGTIELAAMEPLIALPDSIVQNTVPVRQVAAKSIQPRSSAHVPTARFAILPCRRTIGGRQVRRGAPDQDAGSQQIYRTPLRAGYVATLVEAGALVTQLDLRRLLRRAHGCRRPG